MDLSFDSSRAEGFKGPTQKIKRLTEHWVSQQVDCPNCGHIDISSYPANRPVADFYCKDCNEQYELKSQGRTFGPTVGDGAYRTMIERLTSSTNPHLFLLQYDPLGLTVLNLLVIPKHFFVPDIIVRRKPLSKIARRAGWIGCNISLRGIPDAGRIFLVRNRLVEPKENVRAKWRRTEFLRNQKNAASKGWMLSIMRCIEKLNADKFTLQQFYQFENELAAAYPSNRHIKEKIRQKLQGLRDEGYLEFLGKGIYHVVGANSE